MVENENPRNLLGYGRQPPNPEWPDGARLALNFVINVEEGAERCVLYGDAQSENYLTEIANRPALDGQRDFFSESIFEYGSRCGIWRLLRVFGEHDIPMTLWVCGKALEQVPDLGHALAQSSHEVAGHGYRWFDYREVPPEIERNHIQQTIDVIESQTGSRPVGWYSGRKSESSRRLLIEAGMLYDSDSYNDDLPYWTETGNKAQLIIPYTFDLNDAKYFLSPGWTSGEDFLDYLKNSFRFLYREGAKSPKFMTVALHARISGRPGRSEILHRFLEFLQQYPDIWITTRKKIALHWRRHHPFL